MFKGSMNEPMAFQGTGEEQTELDATNGQNGDEKKYICRMMKLDGEQPCLHTFTHKSDLTKHQKHSKFHPCDNYLCEFCGLLSPRSDNFNKHHRKCEKKIFNLP